MPVAIPAIVAAASFVAANAGTIGAIVSVVGLGMNVIGTVTKNETLAKVGGYLGMAGGAITLASGVASVASSMKDGVGSMFSSTKSVGAAGLKQEAMGRAIVAGNNPAAGANFAKAGLPMDQAVLGNQIVANTPMPPVTATKPTILSPNLTATQRADLLTPSTGGNVTSLSQAPPSAGVAPSSIDPLKFATTKAVTGPQAPVAGGGSSGTLGMADTLKNVSSVVPPPGGEEKTPTGSGGIGKWFSDLPDYMKFSIANNGLQAVAGMAGGWFEGASAEERLELEKQALAWKQQYEGKNQTADLKSRGYAPTVTFGTMNRAA